MVVGAIWLGDPWLTLLALLGGGLAVREFYRLTPPRVGRMPAALGVTAVAALLLAAAVADNSDFHIAAGLVLAAWVFAALLWFIACYKRESLARDDSPAGEELKSNREPEEGFPMDDDSRFNEPRTDEEPDEFQQGGYLAEFEPAEDAGWGERPWFAFLFLLLGPVYVGFLLGHGLVIVDLAGDDGYLGRAWLLFTLLVVFACDTGAFAVGRLAGRHRMSPGISPNKTWEGAAGGFAASIGAAMVVGVAFDLTVPLWQQALIGAAASLAAQSGDLFESALKRAASAKDSGSIMPGHGGILDRMDSILFALPAVYYMLLAAGLRI